MQEDQGYLDYELSKNNSGAGDGHGVFQPTQFGRGGALLHIFQLTLFGSIIPRIFKSTLFESIITIIFQSTLFGSIIATIFPIDTI